MVPPTLSVSDYSLNSVSFPTASVGFASGNTYLPGNLEGGALLQYSNGTWSDISSSIPYTSTDYWLPGISFPTTTDGFVAGTDNAGHTGFVLQYSAGTWNNVDLSKLTVSANWYLHAISFATATDGWAVGTNNSGGKGAILHCAAGAWSVDTVPTISSSWQLYRVQAVSATEAWAVGKDLTNKRGVILHYTSGAWQSIDTTALSTSTDWELWTIAFDSSGDGWAGGYDYGGNETGIMLRYQQGTWTNVSSPTFAAPAGGENTGTALSPSNVWVVGEDDTQSVGLIFHFDGMNWASVDLSSQYPSTKFWLYGNAFPSAAEGWAVGESSSTAVIIHYH